MTTNWKCWILSTWLGLISLPGNAVTPMLAADQGSALYLHSDGSVWATGLSASMLSAQSAAATSPQRVPLLSNVVAVAAGDRNYFALLADGTLWAMGVNRNGQLGDGTTQVRTDFQSVPGLSDVKAVVASYVHVLALKQDGTVWAWGNNEYGQLGDGTTTSRYAPTQVLGLADIIQIRTSSLSALALRSDGTVWMWGDASNGGAGDGSSIGGALPGSKHLVPTQVLIDNVTAIAGGNLALRADKTVWVWGQSSNGSTGFPDGHVSAIPEQIPGLEQIVAIESKGEGHAFALKADGSVWAWGHNNRGQLGLSAAVSISTPTQVPALSDSVAIAPAWEYGIAMRSSGVVLSWGLNSDGQLGDGTLQDHAEPRPVLGPGGSGTFNLTQPAPATYNQVPTAQISLSASSGRAPLTVTANALNVNDPDSSSFTYAWITSDGQQSSGALATSATFAFSQPGIYQINLLVEDDAGGRGFTRKEITVAPVAVTVAATPKVGMAGNTAIALSNDGRILLWGLVSPSAGYGGIVLKQPASIPIANGITGAVDFAIWAQGGHALLADGTVLGWGGNDRGTPGAGKPESAYITPQLLPNLPVVKALAAGSDHLLALTNDGRVYAWGFNANGQLGLGDNTDRFEPVEITSLGSGIAGIAAGGTHSVALKADGTVWAWGSVGFDIGGTQTPNNPIQIPGLAGISKIFSSFQNIFAQTADGSTWVTGLLPATTGTTEPRHLAEFDGAVQIDGSMDHVILLKPDGSVWTAGLQQSFALGFADGGDVASLRQVPGITDAIAVAASAALRRDGTVLAWGQNYYGQIGDGTYARRMTPVLVVNETADGYLDLIPDLYFEMPPSVGVPFFTVASGNVADVKASVTTTTKFNAIDLGKSGSVFVTAKVPPGSLVPAPSGMSAIASAATAADAFVLVNLTPSGWQPVVNGQPAAYASGELGNTLSVQTILDNTDTTNLKGAQFCVGYGTSADQMLAIGTMRVVATIPDPNATGTAAPSCIVAGPPASYSLVLPQGWNLLGNSLNQTLSVASLYGDPNTVISVWKWDASTMNWQFYTPLMDATALQTYANSKGYAVLSTINPGDGYWVNAKAQPTLAAQSGEPFIVTSTNLTKGWNLVATGKDITPTQFNANLKASLLGTGVTTLWAWDTPSTQWYFYAPALEAQGATALSSYIASKGYLDFGAKTLGNGTGFWVNRP